LGSIAGNGTGKVDSGSVDEVSNNSKHTDTSVLDLNITEAVELLLVSIGDKAKGIKESKWGLSSELVLERHAQSRGAGLLLGRGKGGSRGNKGGEDSGLHLD
jgi:hypothetical protein